MAWDDFGQSWPGIIFNPAGYLLQRKSNANAANEYRDNNPISKVLSGLESELSYNINRQQWTDACASKLKSDDVGKSKSNALKACESVWDSDPWAMQVFEGIQQNEDAKLLSTEQTTKIRNTLFFVGIMVLLALLIFFLIKKYRTS